MYETHVRRRVPHLVSACNLFYLLILGNNIFGQHLVSDKARPVPLHTWLSTAQHSTPASDV